MPKPSVGAFQLLLNRQFPKAVHAIDRAITALPKSPRLNIRRAHALMFLDRVDETRELYIRYCGVKVDAERTGAKLIAQDFAALHQAGLEHAVMGDIEALLSQTQVPS